MNDIAKLIDHTLLAPDATPRQIDILCQEAERFGFAAVCISPTYVAHAADAVSGTHIPVCTVIGFPSGAHLSEVKASETELAVARGAAEVDMVINVGAAKNGDWDLVEADIASVVKASGSALVKVILETCLLTDAEIVEACKASMRAGADFVKTSTGFSTYGAKPEHVALMRSVVGTDFGVKASGGIRTRAALDEMVAAGANRIGASAGSALL